MKILGFTEQETVCGLCGKSELKGTYAVETENGIIYLGSSCIKKAYQLNQKDFTSKVKKDLMIQKEIAKQEWFSTTEYKMQMTENWEENFKIGEIQDAKRKEIANKYFLKDIY